MKKVFLFVSVVVLVAFSTTSFAQNSAKTTASVIIGNPIVVTQVSDMSFGNLLVGAASMTTPLQVTLSPKTNSLGTLPTEITQGTAAKAMAGCFAVNGTKSKAYNYVLDNAVTLSAGASETAIIALTDISTFSFVRNTVVNGSSGSATLSNPTSGSGSDNLYVGGTITIPVGITDNYYSGTLNVSVSYQ